MTSGEEMRAERLKKLQLLKDAGKDPYPAHSERTDSIEEFLVAYEEGREATLAGRIMSIRGQGGISFIDINDGTGKVQLVLQDSEIGQAEYGLFIVTVDQGDFIEAKGSAFTTKRGEKSLKAARWKMLAKSLAPLPDQWYGIQDEELKLRQRYLDILLNEETRAMFERRAKFWQTIRAFYLEHGFREVETPILESSPGGAEARTFDTHHNALDIDVSLRISLELWLKRLLVAGFPKVFEIGRIFRNEGQSREHLQDYTQWESYESYRDFRYGMEFVKDLYRRIAQEVYGKTTFSINGHDIDLATDWPELNFCALMKKEFGIDPLAMSSKETREIDEKWKSLRKTIAGPTFLTGIPAYMEPLAKRSEEDARVVERFQILFAGSEMGKGFSELNDPEDQRARFEEQQKLREAGDEEAQRLDEEYLEAMEYGMPPSFGFGMSERLFAFLENRPAHETQLFPLLRPKNRY